ncbi:DUF6838 family protein [uncultured Phascolarctobacterium sp.]|uniref:phage tail terminator family protein n=1 Tax=uncultured Phascolarctobacterium sp. TaxID=512296 RepID=UPI0025E10979|nr:hypothetical protein [uncultured Phascolarctobacterium sp.]
MAEIIKQADILKQAACLLQSEFGCKVYYDESREGFDKPCFFIRLVATNTPQTVNHTAKTMAIMITYIPRDNQRNELYYMDVFDRIENIFQAGMQLQERYLHTESISSDRVGKDNDILQIEINMPYLDRIIINKPAAELIEEVDLVTVVNESEDKLWQS